MQAFSSLPEQPAYGPWVDMVARYAGPEAAELLGTYWTHGDPEIMHERCGDAGLRVSAVHEHTRPAYLPNISTIVLTEVKAPPLRDRLDPAQLDQILAESHQVLGQFVRDGRLLIPLGSLIRDHARPALAVLPTTTS